MWPSCPVVSPLHQSHHWYTTSYHMCMTTCYELRDIVVPTQTIGSTLCVVHRFLTICGEVPFFKRLTRNAQNWIQCHSSTRCCFKPSVSGFHILTPTGLPIAFSKCNSVHPTRGSSAKCCRLGTHFLGPVLQWMELTPGWVICPASSVDWHRETNGPALANSGHYLHLAAMVPSLGFA